MAVVTDTTAATTAINGAIITAGGVGVAKSIYSGGQLVAGIDDGQTNAITDLLVLRHTTTGTAANGIGVGISIGIEDAGGVAEQGSMDWVLTDVTDNSEVSQFRLAVSSSGTNANVLTATGTQTAVLQATDSSSTTTGALTVAGGVGVAKKLYTGSIAVVQATTDATDHVTGSLVAVGGLGVGGRIYTGSSMVALGTTPATSKITGALITQGGIGAAKSIYSGGQLVSHVTNTIHNAISDLLVLKHETSGTPANGIGVGISIGIEDATNTEEVATLEFTLTDVTNDGKLLTCSYYGILFVLNEMNFLIFYGVLLFSLFSFLFSLGIRRGRTTCN
jgi:hypothetical protein